MREVTLSDINQKLSSQMKVDESISRGIHGLREDFQKLYGLQEQAIRQAAEAKREGSTGSKEGGAPTPAKNDAKKGTNFLSKGLGDMLGKMTGGIMKGAMGLAAMGIAIPASILLSWYDSVVSNVQADIENLATQAILRTS